LELQWCICEELEKGRISLFEHAAPLALKGPLPAD
jgi:hypothetical protein